MKKAVDAGKRLGVQPVLAPKDMTNPDVEHLGIMAYTANLQWVTPRPPLSDSIAVHLESTSGRVGEPVSEYLLYCCHKHEYFCSFWVMKFRPVLFLKYDKTVHIYLISKFHTGAISFNSFVYPSLLISSKQLELNRHLLKIMFRFISLDLFPCRSFKSRNRFIFCTSLCHSTDWNPTVSQIESEWSRNVCAR